MLLPFHSKLVKIYVKESFEPVHSIIERNLSSNGNLGSSRSVLHVNNCIAFPKLVPLKAF